MRSNQVIALLGAAALLASFAGGAGAQRPPVTTTPDTHHKMGMGGMLGRMRGSMTGHGQIIGNKNTKVYHLPGDTGNMPAEKNRVYFRSEREAVAAGYHVAGKKNGKMTTRTRTRMGHPMTHGMGQQKDMPTSGGRMNGHLPK
jgi:hypothetical protein